MAAVLGFMDGPLVSWIRTLIPGGTVDFQGLCDAVFLNDLLLTIGHRELLSGLNRDAKDSNARIQNWMIFMRNIKTYYQHVLQQLIVMDLPNILTIVHEPDKESGIKELQHVLLLLLGCAVQCEQKEQYINAIKGLDIETQTAIVGYIKQMTDNNDNVVSLDAVEDLDVKSLLIAVRKLGNYRDSSCESLLKISQERDYYRRELEGRRGPLTPPDHLQTVHLYSEFSKSKVQVSHLLNDLEEKGKQLVDLKDELELSKNTLNKLKFENIGLSKDAKSARAYMDELDMLREKAMKADRLEKDLRKYKERLNEMEFYKARVQELREDNNVLLEAKNKIEEQLTAANKRSENMVEDLVRSQLQLEEVSNEKESIQKKMEEIIEENATLEFERANMSEGYRGGLKRILSTSSDLFSGSQLQIAEHPISEELNDSINCKVAKLELDNEALQRELQEANQKLNDAQMELARLKAAAEREYKKKMSELELQTVELRKRNSVELADSVHQKIKEVERQGHEMRKRMTNEYQQKVQKLEIILLDKEQQMERFQEERSKDKLHIKSTEKRLEDVNTEKEKYKSTIEYMQQSSQGRTKQLEQEVASLQALNASLKRRLSDLSQNDINKENAYVALEAERTDHRESSSRHRHGKPASRSHSLSQSFDASDYARMRYPSSKSSRGSTSSIHSIHEMDPRYVSSPKSHRTHRSSTSGSHDSDSERHRHRSSSSQSSFSSSHMQTQEVPKSSVHTQSSPFVRGSSSRSTAPARGIVAPQRRGKPVIQPHPSPSSPFMRHDKKRIPISPSKSKSVDSEPFSRDNILRATMPERKTVYVTPERRTLVERSGSGSPDLGKLRYEPATHRHSSTSVDFYHTLPLQPEKHKMYASTTGVAMNSPTLEKSPSFHEKWKDGGSDSGHATSPESPESSTRFENGYPENDKENKRRLTSMEITSSETIKTHFRASSRTSQVGGEKWKYFVDKIVDLQDKNQKLILENSDLKKVSNTQNFTTDLLRSLKERNLILEVENRKLKKIIEMLQGGGRNPNDPREYHFYTNV